MVAARILGIHEVGLNNLLNTEFGIDLDKRLQKANWGRRPLPEEYLAYARMDTHFLLELRDVLEEKLRAADLWELAQEDFARMTRTSIPLENKIEDELWHIHGARDLDPEEAAIFLQLLIWREEAAQKANRPPFKIISSEQLLMIAQSKICQMATLRHKVRLSPLQLDRYAETILTVVEKGRNDPPLLPPHQRATDPAFRKRLDRLKTFRKAAAEKRKVESDIILPRDLLFDLAQNPPLQLEELSIRMKPYPWRFRHYGKQIFLAIHPRPTRGDS
jgi:ribonuclease D